MFFSVGSSDPCLAFIYHEKSSPGYCNCSDGEILILHITLGKGQNTPVN